MSDLARFLDDMEAGIIAQQAACNAGVVMPSDREIWRSNLSEHERLTLEQMTEADAKCCGGVLFKLTAKLMRDNKELLEKNKELLRRLDAAILEILSAPIKQERMALGRNGAAWQAR